MKKILTFIIMMFLFNINVNAASSCSYKEQVELNSKAANIKVSYELIEKIEEVEEILDIYRVFEISILNITEEFYVVIKNDYNDEQVVLTYADVTNGIVKFNWKRFGKITNFTFEIFTTDKTSCPNERYKTLYLTTPRYNKYYNRAICSNYEDFYLCQKFVMFDEISDEFFLKKLEAYRSDGENVDNNDPQQEIPTAISDKIFNFINEYKWHIVGVLFILLVGIVMIRRNQTKKQRDLGL